MKLPTIAKIRIPIMAAIFIFGIVGFIYFYKQHLLNPTHGVIDSNRLFFLFQTGFWLLIAYLWNDWLQRRGIWFFEVFIVVIFGFGSIFMFAEGEPMSATFNTIISLGAIANILPRLLHPLSEIVQASDPCSVEAEISETSSEAIDHPIRSCVGLFLATLLFLWAAWLKTDGMIPKWMLVIFAMPSLFVALMVYLTRFKRRKNINT